MGFFFFCDYESASVRMESVRGVRCFTGACVCAVQEQVCFCFCVIYGASAGDRTAGVGSALKLSMVGVVLRLLWERNSRNGSCAG